MTAHEHLLDYELTRSHIRDLASADALVAFFARLRYSTAARTPQSADNLGITAESTRRPIRRIELLVDQDGLFQVYLFELDSVTVSHTRALARTFRNKPGNYLLVLTSDWERIDFVYLERFFPPTEQPTLPGIRIPETRLRPRTLTVERRSPSPVSLRVLRRFTWTESDPFAQADKILAAYAIADWSSDYFNNRALFSDHYLRTRFAGSDEWKEDPKPVLRALGEVYRDARKLAGQPLSVMSSQLLEPVLAGLGFPPVTERRFPGDADLPGEALLLREGQPLAWLLPYPWARALDHRDPERDPVHPEENPGVQVVHLLESREIPWVVLTNGQLWRLYGRRARSRATNYFEVDLAETLATRPGPQIDPIEAFRYFWLLFRRQAFEPETVTREGKELQESLLDKLLVESQLYARSLGDRLKDRIFVNVFPGLARGFLEADGEGVTEATGAVPQEELDRAFRATLILLYRLLFLLYAEARNLLPVREVRGYWEISLSRMLDEIAEIGGRVEAQAGDRLSDRFGTDSFELYDRLLRLFEVIDKGRAAVNVPPYNGGLFLSAPEPDDPRPPARSARFLESHKIPDLTLALALDRLARDSDPKSHELGMVDYQSLGVRHLGSIYEGLLEFRLRRATEPMAVTKGKKKNSEVVMRLTTARAKKSVRILTEGAGRQARERLIQPGELYLQNDRSERKATGSYYTPDFVVEHIVRRTVGPLLDQRLEGLRETFREAQHWRQRHHAIAQTKGESKAKYNVGEAVDHAWSSLVERTFDLKVLDPAMGSGHFLVEVVDFVTDRLVDFLAGFPWNPVSARVESMRRRILEQMDQQGIALDPERLTTINLLKRHVLKSCIFGVDVNPMAVELAKVSLWLDSFTLGAPLSFLDHHLRVGNSLLGVSVKEVEETLEGKGTQGLLFGSRFTGLQLAAGLMTQVAAQPDITSEEVQQSQEAYAGATEALEPYRRMLHFYTSQWFSYPLQGKRLTSAALDFLQAPEAEAYFRAPDPVAAEEVLAKLPERDQEIVNRVIDDAATWRFFHWELEFPEVFYRTRSGTRSVTRRPEHGFDAVVGNPPWVRQEGLKSLKSALAVLFPATHHAQADVFVPLLTRGIEVLREGGRLGMILQNKWFKADYGEKLRTYLNRAVRPLEVIDFGHAPLFEDADTFPAILLLEKPASDEVLAEGKPLEEIEGEVGFLAVDRKDLPGLDLAAYAIGRRTQVPRTRLRPEGWELLPKPLGDLMEKIRGRGVPLKEYLGAKPYRGLLTGLNEVFLIDQATRDRLVAEDPGCEEIIQPFLRGENIQRWHSPWGGEWILLIPSSANKHWPWSDAADEATAEEKFRKAYPSLHAWMRPLKKRLRRRQDQGRYWWELRACSYYEAFAVAKLMYQDLSFHSSFCLDEAGLLSNNTCYFLPHGDAALLGILNSSLCWWLLSTTAQHGKDEAFRIHSTYLEKLPIAGLAEVGEATAQKAEKLKEIVQQRQELECEFLAGIPVGLDVTKISRKLENFYRRTDESFLAELRKAGAQLATRAREIELLKEFRASREKVRALRREIAEREIELHHQVYRLYGLTPEEIHLLRQHAPPRDPLVLAEQELARLQRDPEG